MYQPLKSQPVATIRDSRDSKHIVSVGVFTPVRPLWGCFPLSLKLQICKTSTPKLSVQLNVHEQHSVQIKHTTLNNQFYLPGLMMTNFLFLFKHFRMFCYITYFMLNCIHFTDQVRNLVKSHNANLTAKDQVSSQLKVVCL